MSPLQTSEPYYADTLRIHLGVVAEALELLGLWPVSMPLLLQAAQATEFESIRKQVRELPGPTALHRRVEEQAAILASPSGRRDIASGAARLRVVVGTSWARCFTRVPTGEPCSCPSHFVPAPSSSRAERLSPTSSSWAPIRTMSLSRLGLVLPTTRHAA